MKEETEVAIACLVGLVLFGLGLWFLHAMGWA